MRYHRCRHCGWSYRSAFGFCPYCGWMTPFFIQRRAHNRMLGGCFGPGSGCLGQLAGCFLRLMLSGILIMLCIGFFVLLK